MIAHILACTPVALAAAAAVLLLGRRGGAAFRHAVLLVAVLRFAIPTDWLGAAGSRLAPHIAASTSAEELGALLLHPGAATLRPVVDAATRSPQPWIALWAAGCLACLAAWALRALRRVPAVRPPNEIESEILAGLPLRIVAANHVPGACGWLRPCVVLPDGLSAQLTPAELRAVAAHEVAHIQRHDNLWAALAHLVVAVFWFHPLLWWIERRMLAEREAACDEMVLEGGADPADYVAALAKVCRMSFAGATGYAGVTGSSLARRMEQIMTMPYHRTASRLARATAGAALATFLLLPVAAGFLRAQEPTAQHLDPLFEAGRTALDAKRYDEAYEDFRKCQEAYPYPTNRGLMGMVEVRMAQGRNNDAIALLEAQVAIHPDVPLKLALGNILVRSGNYARALNLFQSMEPTGDLYIRMGETYRRMGQYDDAIAALRKAKESMPESVMAVSTLALTLEQSGHFEEAARGYRDTLALSPNNGIALNNLAYLVAEQGGDLDVALNYARRARQAIPQEPNVDDTLGWIYLKRQQTTEAIAAFRTAYNQKPAEPAFRTHLAQAIEQRGDTSKEADELKLLLREPSSPANDERVRVLLDAIQ